MLINMKLWYSYILILSTVSIIFVSGAVIAEDADVQQQGLYSKSEHVDILTAHNFDKKVYGQNQAYLVQFYNSYCGHCRAFAPKFKDFANQVVRWKNVMKLGVIDCSIEENNEICRQFEIMAYPSLRYLHANYAKGNGNVGEKIQATDTAEALKEVIIHKLQTEKTLGRLPTAPSFDIASYTSYSHAVRGIPANVLYTFLVFEKENSTLGSEIALDIHTYKDIALKRVQDVSQLAEVAGIRHSPGLVAVRSTLEPTNLTPKDGTKTNFIKTINQFLRSKNYAFPEKDFISYDSVSNEFTEEKPLVPNADIVFYSDLEKTLKTSLHTEITRHKTLTGEPLQALIDYLDVLITSFPAKGNLREYLTDLRNTIVAQPSWDGTALYETVKRLEEMHAPVYTSNLEYMGCKGSLPKYRGYTCGLWTLFHTLTVNAARKQGNEGPKVLKAMHGYVKHFFGCTECSQHFQAMADRNRIFDVKENDKAVLWLWISHNEVNLRLAGDVTEDPHYAKIQFPSIKRCPECRLARGAWNLPAVYQYLQRVYGSENIREVRRARSAVEAPAPFSNLDIGMLSLLYILSFIILILVIRYLLTKRFYRKRVYKHGRGKV